MNRWISVAIAATAVSIAGLGSSQTVRAEAARDTSGVIEEIVVTSRRRNESQQDVPASVTALTPKPLNS